MTTLTIQLDADALREATAQAMLSVLTPEVRNNVMRAAIEAILKPSTESWRNNISPLQEAFNQAVQQVARKEAEKYVLENTEFVGKIRALIEQASGKLAGLDAEALSTNLIKLLQQSMKDRY